MQRTVDALRNVGYSLGTTMDLAFDTTHLVNFAIALALGLLMGAEREVSKRVHHTAIGGIRTFPLSSVIGYLVGFLSGRWGGIVAAAGIVGIAAIAVAVGARGQTRGITTELALMLTGVVGVALGSGAMVPALLGAVIGAVLLSQKVQLHRWVESLTPEDIRAIITFAVVAAVVLPLLPDVPLGPRGVLNPRQLWSVVALVTAVNVAGYVATKYLSARQSLLLSAIIGSLVSSTAVTWSLASQSRDNPRQATLCGIGIALASGVMFARVGFFAAVLSRRFIAELLPVLLATAAVGLAILWLVTQGKWGAEGDTHSPVSSPTPGNPARLKSAMLFGAFYAAVATLGAVLHDMLGSGALISLGAASGLADLDAITIAMGKEAAANTIAVEDAAATVIAAMLANTLVKLSIAVLRGERTVRRIAILSLGASAVVLAAGLVRSFVQF
ncbi:MAG: MgtC/SapB family protein [Bacteroidota bacterium]|nr:DUF4010 domain-containing protein [Candidatus Kapabacteria bacterium]MCX7937085.1 DUF4010 domain-containing protein [Chlorobiota bacterium]MDW8075184.1 MgtC/SapB family protein [Bacteroidota bacterium]MDW8272415.1 MgtC/SapB family protein [Bacteroidota bacterium]